METDDQCKLIRNWIERQVLEQIADYLARGRALAGRDYALLRRHWIAQMALWSSKTASPEDHKLREDIQAEMRIRGFQPPYEAVKDDLLRLAAMAQDAAEAQQHGRRRFRRAADAAYEALRASTKSGSKSMAET